MRTAGFLYLIVAVLTSLAGLVNTSIVVPGNATATATNIKASMGLYRLGFLSELLGATAFLLTAVALYRLLAHVNRLVAGTMVIFVAVSVAMQSLNLLNQQTALTLASSSDELTLLFTEMQHNGYLIAQTYFGLWLLPLAYLVTKSGFFPKFMGVLLAIGCCGHLTDVFTRFLAPDLGAAISPFAMTPAAVAEITFIAWLLLKPRKYLSVTDSPSLTGS
ncbi:DUF4386 domain-containing protein [Nonomuraea sp. NPDC050556]|uniref:DUF4386 domain-containing protein n=1 Tax=Nonomuraea sp. NPDC050556 TaxID=3364369 RepID=UPI0037B6D0D7